MMYRDYVPMPRLNIFILAWLIALLALVMYSAKWIEDNTSLDYENIPQQGTAIINI